MSNPTEFTAYKCSACGKGYGDRDAAERCCTCTECGLPIEPRGYCVPCSHARIERYYESRLAAAELIEDTGDYVFSREVSGDKLFSDVSDLVEHCCETETEVPSFVFACKKVPFRINLDRVLESIEENMSPPDSYEPMDMLQGLPELRAAVDAFNEQNKDVCVWQEDTSRKIAVPQE